MDPDTLAWMLPASLAATITMLGTIATLWFRLKSVEISTTTVQGEGRGQKINHTISLVKEYSNNDFIPIRSRAWAVREKVIKEELAIRPIVQHLLGDDADPNSPLAQHFPFDESLKDGLSHFQCVAQIVAYWETFYVMKHENLLQAELLWPLRAHFRHWLPFFTLLVNDAEEYLEGKTPQPSWIKHLPAINTEWMAG